MKNARLSGQSISCVFCQNTTRTREHWIPKWMHKILPPTGKIEQHEIRELEVEIKNDGTNIIEHRVDKIGNGSVRYRSLNVACKSCNTGWMSRLQMKAKPLLTPLVKGDNILLDEDAQSIIVQWIVMTVMTSQVRFASAHVITKSQREDFRISRSIPEGWCILIGNYRGLNWKCDCSHGAVTNTNEHEVPTPDAPNAFSMQLGIGKFAFYVIGATHPSRLPKQKFIITQFLNDFDMTPILPNYHPVIDSTNLGMSFDKEMDDMTLWLKTKCT